MAVPQVGRFGTLLRRIFALKESYAPSILEDFFPSLDLWADRPELFKIRDERLFAVSGRGLGGVGAQGQVWCMNKVPGNLAVITTIVLSHAGAGLGAHLALTTVGLPADGAGGQNQAVGWDTREASTGFVIKPSVTGANDTTGAGSFGGLRVALGENIVVPVRIVLKSGWAAVTVSDVAGAGNDVWVSYLGYERAAEPSELGTAP